MLRKLLGEKTAGVTEKEVNALYKEPRPITDWLPWIDYNEETRTFSLEDGLSVGAMFEVTGVSTEARSDAFLQEIHANIQTSINHTIPQHDNPFVLQCFVQDEESLAAFCREFEDYIAPERRDEPLTRQVVGEVKSHLKRISNPNGFFEDTAISGGAWNGKIRRVRCFLYRRISRASKTRAEDLAVDTEAELNEVAEKFAAQMKASGVRIRRCDESDLYAWLVRWFNPKAEANGGDLDKLLATIPCPSKSEKVYGHDLSQLVMLSQPVSDAEHGLWWFDDLPHRVITVNELRRKPQVGHLTGERRIGENLYAVFDRLPSGTILSICITIQPQDLVENKIIGVLNASKGEAAEARAAQRDAEQALEWMPAGDYLFPTVISLFIRGDDMNDLQAKTNQANAMLLATGLHPIREKDELLPLHAYIRQLPMNYEPARDKQKQARLMFSSDLAKLLPFYGRSRGTGHPGLIFFNRGAEPLCFDPLNKKDRSKNAFGLVLGPPGSGKSALMVYILLMVAAVYKARIFIIEKGGSFKLYGEFCKQFGLSVNQVSLSRNANVSLPPFGDAFEMLTQEVKKERMAQGDHEEASIDYSDSSDDNDEERDYLGEMELKTRVMITGGDPKEEAKMTRADRLTIRKAIVNAAKRKQQSIAEVGNQALLPRQRQVLTEDVVAELNVLSQDPALTATRRERAKDMADAMELYCSGTAGFFFNRPGEEWPEADVTIMEMGLLSGSGYEDQLALAFMGLMNQITSIVERDQYEERPTFVLTDEAHLITTNMLLSIYLVKIVKMWRKLGAWLWLATQNLEDFPDEAKKLLSMFEWWIAMSCPKEQVEQIARFKDLTEEQKHMLLAAHKEPGKYTEGVVLADKIQALLRNVPPPLALALAMTEKHEKRERARIMEELGCGELEACFKVAEDIARKFEINVR